MVETDSWKVAGDVEGGIRVYLVVESLIKSALTYLPTYFFFA